MTPGDLILWCLAVVAVLITSSIFFWCATFAFNVLMKVLRAFWGSE